jgi:hypothetical protein
MQCNRSVRLSPDFPNKNPAPSQKINKTDITELTYMRLKVAY